MGLHLNCPSGGYIIQGPRCHLYKDELPAQLYRGFKQILCSQIDSPTQKFNFEQILLDSSVDKNNIHVVAFENTHNFNGGKCMDMNIFNYIVKPKIKKYNYKLHLDG